MARAGVACSAIASTSLFAFLNMPQPFKHSCEVVQANPRYLTEVSSSAGISQALRELDVKGFFCIGPSTVPRAISTPCREARSPGFMPCYSQYRPQAPHRFHRTTFDEDTLKELRDLERSTWIPLVEAYFAKHPTKPATALGDTINTGDAPPSFQLNRDPASIERADENEEIPATKGRVFYRSDLQLIHTAPGAAAQFFHQDNRRRGLTVAVPLVDVYPTLGPTQASLQPCTPQSPHCCKFHSNAHDNSRNRKDPCCLRFLSLPSISCPTHLSLLSFRLYTSLSV
jgi:hypothetical protein